MSVVFLGQQFDGHFIPYGLSSLREIEQEVARRVGPFFMRWANKGGVPGEGDSTTSAIVVPALRSNIDMGGLEDLFVLRRGRLRDGTLLPFKNLVDEVVYPYTSEDRIRMVRQYRPQDGVIEVDRPYRIAPNDQEEIELHKLDPEQELRPAVLAGLRRCYIVDRFEVQGGVAGSTDTIDLTEQAPWIMRRDQIYGVSMRGGAPLTGWRAEPYGGGITLSLREYTYGKSYVTNRRPAVSLVLIQNTGWGQTGDFFPPPELPGTRASSADVIMSNEEWVVRTGNLNENWRDEDRFPVPLDYAAAAGHIECWRTVRPRLMAVTALDMWAKQAEAAAEFTRVSTVYFDPPRHEPALSMSSRLLPDNPLTNAG
jgi:hypothetical protein